jgi:hypothetical protein
MPNKWLNMTRQHSSFNSPRSVIIVRNDYPTDVSLAAAAPLPKPR